MTDKPNVISAKLLEARIRFRAKLRNRKNTLVRVVPQYSQEILDALMQVFEDDLRESMIDPEDQ